VVKTWCSSLLYASSFSLILPSCCSFLRGFIEHYIVPFIYPEGLTSDLGIALGIAVIFTNLEIYSWLLRRTR
jgi:hypothetical protein